MSMNCKQTLRDGTTLCPGICLYHNCAMFNQQKLNAHVADAAGGIAELEKQNADLKMEVIAFCAPWAVQYARDHELPPGSLHSVHYDILARCGALMEDFTRHEDAAREPGDE